MRLSLVTFLVICLEFLCQKGKAQSNQCKENEEFQECASGCPLTCQNYRESYFCDIQCKSGCFCRPGYVKGPGDKCIRPSQCPIDPCKDNEEVSTCMNPCNNCIQKGKCYFEYCIKGCDCKPGFYRNSTGTCVVADKCGSETHLCPPNEHYAGCVNNCNDCWSKGQHCSDTECVPGCDCNSGYFRDDYGNCIPEQQCDNHDIDGICGANEVLSDCVSPCNDCEHKGHCDHHECHFGCDCKIGYFRNHDGHCIPEYECAAITCGHYEEYSECGSACPISCDNYNTQVPCTLHCVKGCFCSRGYIRGPGGICIKPNECPKVCGRNEEYRECGSACPANCTNPNPTCGQVCVRGCFCKPGYIRDPYGVCILQTNCPLQCNEFEEFKECGSNCPPICNERNRTCSGECVRGCFCIPGYIKDPNGKCVLPSQCPQTCPENETYRLCGTNCPITCHNIGRAVTCKQHCVKGCFCNDGFVRADNETCIRPELCPMRCGQNEVLKECGTPCQLTCANYTNPGPCAASCVRGCFCRRGYVRNTRGKCITTKHCPARCKEHEVLSCGIKSCESSCQDRDGFSRPCIGDCVNGCYCRRGFVRAPDGNCVPRSECPRINRFDGRNIGGEGEENDNVTLSSTPAETKSSLETKTRLMTDSLPQALTSQAPLSVKPQLTTQAPMSVKALLTTQAPLSAKSQPTQASLLAEAILTTQAPLPAKSQLTTQAPLSVKALLSTQVPLAAKVQLTTQAPLSVKALLTTQVPLATKALLTQAPLITNANLDQVTKLDEILPINGVSLPIDGISLPIVGRLLDEAVSTPANVEQAFLSTASSSIITAKESSQNTMIMKTSQLSDKSMAMTSKLPEKSSENPMITMEPMSSQTPIQSMTSSKLTESTNMAEVESSTPTTDMDFSSMSTINDTTV